VTGVERAALARAKARLDRLDLYPTPLRMRRTVRLLHARWLFAVPGLRSFDGWTAWDLVFLREPVAATSDDLICHELCHVWQMQHHPLRMPLSYLRTGYAANPYEREAREAASSTSSPPPGS
jgi:hypothetical protein